MTSHLLRAGACCLLLCGCQASSTDVGGHYVGTLRAGSAAANVDAVIYDVDGALSGTASGTGLTFQALQYYVAGSQQDGSVAFTISAGFESESVSFGYWGACRYSLVGISEGSALHGSFSTDSCEDASAGTFVLQRQ